MTHRGLLLLISVVSALQLAASPALGAGEKVRVFFTANRQGEIEPCGCQVHQIGGIDRLFNYMDKERAALPSLFVDSGDTFFSSKTLNPNRVAQEKLRAEVIAAAYKKIGVDAVTPGEKDFAQGVPYYRELATKGGFTVVSANLTDEAGKSLFTPYVVLTKGGKKIAVTGLTVPAAVEGVAGVKAADPRSSLKETLATLKKEKPDAVLLLSNMGLAADKEFAKDFEVTAIFGARSLDLLSDPERVGKVWITQPQIQGQQIGVADFGFVEPEKVDHRLVDLDIELDAPKNDITKAIESYKSKVRDLALASAADVKKPSSANPFVANAGQCRNCHSKQYDFWAGTKHASAYLVLYAKNQHFDPECISCHSLGFEEPGGFQNIAQPIELDEKPSKKKKKAAPFVETLMKTVFKGDKGGELDSRIDPVRASKLHARYTDEIKKLNEDGKIQKLYIGVQCEHCHGNRNGHPDPKVATLKKVDLSSCKSCHTPPHAKPFDPTKFPNVACPVASKS